MMAKEAKKKWESFVTPKGIAVWPHLHAPDTKHNAQGLYKTKLAFDPADPKAQAFLDTLDAKHEEWCEQAKAEMTPKAAKTATFNAPFSDELDDDGNETGRKLVNFKMFATRKDKKDGSTKTNKPRFFDSMGNPIIIPPKIGSGSVLRINYSISNYSTAQGTGITLYLNSVQIIELIEWNGEVNAKSQGFDEEDGWVNNAEAAAEGFTPDETGDESDNSGASF